MADKFDRFSKRARHVLTLAQEEAQRLNHNYIGTEHLLLGLVREENGVAIRVLRDLGVDPKQIRERVEHTVGRGQRAIYGKLSLTPRTKRVIELAVDEARRLGHHRIGTEHLLLGLVRSSEGVAVDVLKGLGIDLDKVRSQTARVMMEEGRPKLSPGEREAKNIPLLDQLMIDLTHQALTEKLDPVIGRQVEIDRVIQILSRRDHNNPLIVGHSGAGKTAIVHGLAQRIASGDAPPFLLNRKIMRVDHYSFEAMYYRGQMEEQLMRVIDQGREANVIWFMDNIQMPMQIPIPEFMRQGSRVFQVLQVPIARGETQLIGTTTVEGYETYLKPNILFARSFAPIFVKELSVDETIAVLKGARFRYETHHNIEITDEALEAAAHLSDQYIRDRYQPDKSIQIIDEAAAKVRLERFRNKDDLAILGESEGEPLLENQVPNQLTRNDILDVISIYTGIPKEKL